ncbi:MAG TPA: hypothetical protein VE395_12005 [Acidimicrobiales bacterium]|nr:hypothetical protein [Acidimicrobiales bacterium]
MQPSVIGLFVGLILGLILEIDGFGAMVVTAVIGLVGYVVGKVIQGEIDLGELIDRTRRQ